MYSMWTKFFILLQVYCVLCHQAKDFKIDVYDRPNLEGNYQTYTSYQPDLRSSGFDNKICSASLNGIWVLYEGLDFNRNGGMSFFAWGRNYEVINLQEMNYKTSSLRSVGVGNILERSSLNLYERSGFGGREQYYSSDIPFFMEKIDINSLIITGCYPWTLYSEKYFDGDRICVFPGDYYRCYPGFFPRNKDFGNFGSRMKSARIGCFSDVKADKLEILPNSLFSIDSDLLKLISNETESSSAHI